MKNKSIFSLVILLVILAIVCVVVTVAASFFAGSISSELFDFRNLNITNMIPVFIIGVFITCIVMGICFLFIARKAFNVSKDYFTKDNKNNGGTSK